MNVPHFCLKYKPWLNDASMRWKTCRHHFKNSCEESFWVFRWVLLDITWLHDLQIPLLQLLCLGLLLLLKTKNWVMPYGFDKVCYLCWSLLLFISPCWPISCLFFSKDGCLQTTGVVLDILRVELSTCACSTCFLREINYYKVDAVLYLFIGWSPMKWATFR